MTRVLRWLAVTVVMSAVLVGLAGRWDLPRLWAYAALCYATGLIGVFTIDAEVTRERLRRGQKTADPLVLFLLRAFSMGHIVLGVLDIGRLHWSDSVPVGGSVVGLTMMAAAFRITLSAVAANRFFVPAVRIQKERGHRVVDTGLYRWVRHPGYAGMLLFGPGSGLALGSWLACVVGLAASAVFAFRAAREDGFLKANLEGYAEYATRTRYRLVPGLW